MSKTIVSTGFRPDRKYLVKCEMLGNNRGKLENGEPDQAEGGYKAGEIVTPAQLGVDQAGIDRLVALDAVEPYVVMVPQEV